MKLLSMAGIRDRLMGSRVAAPLSLPSEPAQQAIAEPSHPVLDVAVGREGWLFLVGGTNSALRFYTDPSYFTDEHARQWVSLVDGRKARLAARGVQYLHIAAPDKISVYPEKLSIDLPNFQRHPIRLFREKIAAAGLGAVLIDPLPIFATHPARDTLYLKTDTHWSYHAGIIVLGMVAARLGAPRTHDISGRPLGIYTHTFDLGSKLAPPVQEEYFSVPTSWTVRRAWANNTALIFERDAPLGKPVTHGGINVVWNNSSPDAIDRVLVIFGDSFMDFQPSNASIVFAEHFRETHFVWSPSLDYSYIERVGANLVVSETAERFMISVPTDDYEVSAT